MKVRIALAPNKFEGGGNIEDDPDIPMYGSTQLEAVITGHRMPAWNRFWNKNFRSKSGWDKYVDRYYARQQQMLDTNNTPNPNYEVPDALSISGIVAGTPYNEDIERAKVWDTYNNWKEHNEIIGPHYDPDGNYHNDAYANPSAGYLSGNDPVGEFFVLNEALGPLAKFIGRGAQQVMAKAGNQWARNQIMGRAFNNAADASFGFNNRFVTTPASSMGYETKPAIRTSINSSDPKGWTSEQWTEAQDAAIARGDMAEAQRLRDLHFNTFEKPQHYYRGSNSKRNTYFRDDGSAVWITPDKKAARHYAATLDNLRDLYVRLPKNIIEVDGKRHLYDDLLPWELPKEIQKVLPDAYKSYIRDKNYDFPLTTTDVAHYAKKAGYPVVKFKNVADATTGENPFYEQIATREYNNIKLADAVTYDDNGIRIPLGKRDNFNINDIRYGLAPLGFGIPYLMNNNNNQYPNGGILEDEDPIGRKPIISTTGTAPGVNIKRPLSVASNLYIDYITRGMPLADVRRNLYDYLNPRGYESSISANLSRFENAINKIPDKQIKQNVILEGRGYDPQLDDIWATYLNIPKSKRHTHINKSWNDGLPAKRVIPSKYKPTKGNQNNKYYTLSNINDKELSALVNEGSELNYNESALSEALYDSLHKHTISKGHDNKGTYVSFYDLWDVAPIYGSSDYQGGLSDQSAGIGTPINFYDRIYLDDYYGVPRDPRSNYIPEVIIKPDEEWRSKHYPSLYK